MRLTFKGKNPFDGKEQYYPYLVRDDEIHFEKQTECNNKLGELEDIEDELGIDLITLFKALKDGVRTENRKDKTLLPCLVRLGDLGFALDFMYERESQYFLSDYGKTWALTKGELE